MRGLIIVYLLASAVTWAGSQGGACHRMAVTLHAVEFQPAQAVETDHHGRQHGGHRNQAKHQLNCQHTSEAGLGRRVHQ